LVTLKANHQSSAPSDFCSAASVKEASNTCIKCTQTKQARRKYLLFTKTHKYLPYQ